MTGDDRLVSLTADPALISASTLDTPATLKERPNSQRMREKEDETLHGYLLRELTIDSVTSGNWDNISEISLNPVPAPNGYNRSSVWIPETASVTPTNHLTPLKTFSIETSDKYSSCNQNNDVVKRRQPVLTRSEIFVESSTFHPEKYVLNNSPTNPNNDTANQNSNNVAKTPSIYSISSSILNISSLASPTRDSNQQRVDSHGVALFSNLRVGGAKPASLRKVNFSPKDASSEPTKAVTFRSDFSDSVASNSSTFVGSGNDLTQSPKPSILKVISPTNLRKSPDNICLEYQETAPQHEVNDRSVVREIRKTNAATRVSLDKEHETALDSDVVVRTGLLRCANLSTQKGRRNHALMIMLVSVIPVIALLIQNSIGVYTHSLELQQHSAVKGDILFSVDIGNLLHRTQIERGTTALYVSSKGDATILQNLTTAYRETDKVISNLTRWVVEPNISYFQSVESYHARLKDFRSQVLSTAVPNMTVPQVIKFYSDDNAFIVRWVGQVIQRSKSGDLWKTLVGYYMLILSKEQAGVERALGSTFYAKGGYNDQEMLGYLERNILGMTYLERCTEYSTSVNILLKNVFIGKETDINLQRMRSEILRNALNGSDVVMGAQWFNNMTKYINILKVSASCVLCVSFVVERLLRSVRQQNVCMYQVSDVFHS